MLLPRSPRLSFLRGLREWMHGLQEEVCPVPRGQEVYKYTGTEICAQPPSNNMPVAGRRLILPEFGKSYSMALIRFFPFPDGSSTSF